LCFARNVVFSPFTDIVRCLGLASTLCHHLYWLRLASWPQAKVKCLPRLTTARVWKVPHGLARIVAVAHSGVMQQQQSDAIRLKYKSFQLT
jgi:hypothetical protein